MCINNISNLFMSMHSGIIEHAHCSNQLSSIQIKRNQVLLIHSLIMKSHSQHYCKSINCVSLLGREPLHMLQLS